MPRIRWAVILAAAPLLAACGMSMPADPNGTLQEVTGGTIQVGVTAAAGEEGNWVRLQPGAQF